MKDIKSFDLIEELKFNDKFLTDEYKQSNYYREYLDKVNEELKTLTFP